MLFNSYHFFIFVIIVLVCKNLFNRYETVQKIILLLSCYYFYGLWSWPYLALILTTTTVDFFVAQRIHQKRKPKVMVLTSLCVNLGILCFFKYANFFIDTTNKSLGFLGGTRHLALLNILLPVGISFYTFKSISYVIDVYRGNLKPRRNYLDYALYVSFFTNLLAGPIVRATTFFPQLDSKEKPSFFDVQEGVGLILFGLVKKMVIADNLALLASPAFNSPSAFGAWDTLLGVYAYTFQIYFDFSGYSDIAIGTSKLFGFRFLKNFDHPYVSTSFQEFWRRWHISLSTWLRDYLYIGMGGSRRGRLCTVINIMITMLLGGLWHGASWNFVLWGGLHGAYLTVERQLRTMYPRFWESKSYPVLLLRLLLVFNITALTWVFFRSSSFSDAIKVFHNLLAVFASTPRTAASSVCLLLSFFLSLHLLSNYSDWQERLRTMHGSIITGGYSIALISLVFLSPNTFTPFIYFKF